MIRIENIQKQFGNFHVLKNVSLACQSGASIALIGPNGSGKTTMIKSLLGMVIPTSGKIYFNGMDIKGEWLYREKIGYMPQMNRYPEHMNIGQVIKMVKDIRKNKEYIDEELIEQFQLKDIYYKKMGTLSGGTKQKVGACLAFLFNPSVLILDEPTAGLDPLSSEILKNKIIKEHQKGKTIIISSHILSELDEIVNEVIYMMEGEVKFHEKIDELKKRTNETKLSKMIAKIMIQLHE